MIDANETFAQAWRCHQAGDMMRAEQLYRQLVQSDPRHADAWCFLAPPARQKETLSKRNRTIAGRLSFCPAMPAR